jgi:hypothetical protein
MKFKYLKSYEKMGKNLPSHTGGRYREVSQAFENNLTSYIGRVNSSDANQSEGVCKLLPDFARCDKTRELNTII